MRELFESMYRSLFSVYKDDLERAGDGYAYEHADCTWKVYCALMKLNGNVDAARYRWLREQSIWIEGELKYGRPVVRSDIVLDEYIDRHRTLARGEGK